MVRILANGDIVPDNDPRVQSSSAGASAINSSQGRPQQGGGAVNDINNRRVIAHGPDVSVLDSLNRRLTELGIPTYNIGPYPVEPIASVGFLLSLLFFGLSGLFFSGLLFFVVKYSQMGLGGGRTIRLPAWLSRMGFGGSTGGERRTQNTHGSGGTSESRQGTSGSGQGRAVGSGTSARWSAGGGNRLGES